MKLKQAKEFFDETRSRNEQEKKSLADEILLKAHIEFNNKYELLQSENQKLIAQNSESSNLIDELEKAVREVSSLLFCELT